ncbi:succinate-semialdehyde dehydrogenase / glutarate-semialdehyde dehydrogenase [Nocardioides exalbidus]|uniref:Succinate-semialdehyde dehydrogenase / glutarate-semialdehyde dehydrogenase n=1 Tax=Nocardioides exalbidus TaxID=402596 RepID=A0A1H4U2Q5_9ACTN|nr:NAD-dependent succinate-semialdehyde dehydrogenase [Nocardioides exalbidus]SEC62999.1 succinate-semialdehyde dehydrogenase / glutarate-semialdehyde dehydrogenase [Nocardioides exalbidus]
MSATAGVTTDPVTGPLPRIPLDLLVGGAWESTAERFTVDDPASLTTIARVADAGEAEARAAVTAAHDAFGPWAERAPRQRAEVLRRAHELMVAEAETGALLITRENGKAWRDALGEVTYAAEFFRWFAEEAVRVRGDFRTAPGGDKTIIVDHHPIGVAYLVTPWNFPAAMATRKIAPALAAGCTCILKPAAETPLTALWIGDVLQRAGVPAGVVNILPTSDPGPLSDVILGDARVATLSFTGSTPVGKQLMASTASRALRVSMELGGNAPFLVLEGADVDQAVEIAVVAKMRNGGSACTAANRLYVHASLAEDLGHRLTAAFAELRMGPGADRATELGSMVSTREQAKVHQLLEVAESEGGRVVQAQAAPDGGAFVAPYVVHDVAHGGTLTSTEIFGPVAPIIAFDSVDEAVRMANDTTFGLISYVVSGDTGRGIQVARRMESGMVAVNKGVLSDPAAPFGGMKESGIGREGGFAGIHEFLESQYIAADL